MACRGVLFALTEEQEKQVLTAGEQGDESLEECIEEIEGAWDKENLEETDKAWDAIHRCLCEGTLTYEGGHYPFNRAIIGGKQLYQGDDYIVAFVTKNEVQAVASALKLVTEPWLNDQFVELINTDFPEEYVDEEGFEYTWGYFQDVHDFYRRAASAGRSVIFTVDQ